MGARPIMVGTSPATGQKYFDWEVHLLSLQNMFFSGKMLTFYTINLHNCMRSFFLVYFFPSKIPTKNTFKVKQNLQRKFAGYGYGHGYGSDVLGTHEGPQNHSCWTQSWRGSATSRKPLRPARARQSGETCSYNVTKHCPESSRK